MKASYKLGTLVEYKLGDETKFGLVTAIVTKSSGFTYVVDENVEASGEMIVAAYAPIKTRSVGAKKKRAPRAKKNVDVGVELDAANAMN